MINYIEEKWFIFKLAINPCMAYISCIYQNVEVQKCNNLLKNTLKTGNLRVMRLEF